MNIFQSLPEGTETLADNDKVYIEQDSAELIAKTFIFNNFKDIVESFDQTSAIVRDTDGCYKYVDKYWGKVLVPTEDPLAYFPVTTDDLKNIEVNPDIPKIPKELWSAWVKLCFHYVKSYTMGTLEVSCRILQNETDPSQYKIIIPRQQVTGVSVRAKEFGDSIDIVTGEVITTYPLPGWRSHGSSHSHNTMGPSPSATDDKFELTDPGFHSIIGNINVEKMTYSLYTCVTSNKTRFVVPMDALIDTEVNETTFHLDVLGYVTIKPPKTMGVWTANTSKFVNNKGKWSAPVSTQTRTSYSPWEDANYTGEYGDPSDPFFVSEGYSNWEYRDYINGEVTPPSSLESAFATINNALNKAYEEGDNDVISKIENYVNKVSFIVFS